MPALALIFMILLTTLHLVGRLSIFILMTYVVMSIVTFMVYGVDKYTAARRRSRTPERTLHLLALLGGWPGAVLAQTMFRHKTKKGTFMKSFKRICMINTGILLAWLVLR